MQRLERDFRRIGDLVHAILGPGLVGLILVGSYARGQGGMVIVHGEPTPYNDYDFIVVVRGGARRWRQELEQLGHSLGTELGIDVDLWPINDAHLKRRPPTLFWLDVAMGGMRVIVGKPDLAGRLQTLSPHDVPLDEAGRLLANRAMGIALSNMEGLGTDPLRASRHAHKALLACGDAILLAVDRYRPTLKQRLGELEQLCEHTPTLQGLSTAYRDACSFKSDPGDWVPPIGSLHDWYRRLVNRIGRWHLEFEHLRIGTPTVPIDYAQCPRRLFRVSPVLSVPSFFESAVRGVRLGFPLYPYVGHLRERLARVAVLLAYAPTDQESRQYAARLLGMPNAYAEDVERFRKEAHHRLQRLAKHGG